MPAHTLDLSLLTIGLFVALAAPLLAVRYLRPILMAVLRRLCPDADAADFWLRCCQLLAVCGSLVLTLLWGDFRIGQPLAQVLHRSLLLAAGGVFVSVGFIARSVWTQVRRQQTELIQATLLADARARPAPNAPHAPAAPATSPAFQARS